MLTTSLLPDRPIDPPPSPVHDRYFVVDESHSDDEYTTLAEAIAAAKFWSEVVTIQNTDGERVVHADYTAAGRRAELAKQQALLSESVSLRARMEARTPRTDPCAPCCLTGKHADCYGDCACARAGHPAGRFPHPDDAETVDPSTRVVCGRNPHVAGCEAVRVSR